MHYCYAVATGWNYMPTDEMWGFLCDINLPLSVKIALSNVHLFHLHVRNHYLVMVVTQKNMLHLMSFKL